jgi:hypothetical protein
MIKLWTLTDTIENKKLDFYSAARIGFIFWNINLESTQIVAIDAFSAIGAGRPAVAFTPLRGTYYITEHFAFNFEHLSGLYTLQLRAKLYVIVPFQKCSALF